jgi:methionyl-tRNA formyltransferase
MDVVFFGSGAFGLPTLEWMVRHHALRMVVTQPDRPAGRGAEPTPTPIGAWATTSLPQAPLLKPAKVNDPAVVAQIRGTPADAWVVIAFGQKLGRALLEDVFAINLHASLLPRWRGAAPINAAILAGDTRTGNSVITLADRMDAGLVLAQSHRGIDPEQTAGELHDLLAADGPALVGSVLDAKATGAVRGNAQNESEVTIAPKLSKSDGWVDFNADPETCRRRIHGLTPWPGVTVQFRDQPLKVLRARVGPTDRAGETPGTVVDPDAGLVACAGGTLFVLEVHPAGRRAMPWADFARGHRIARGERMIGKH